MPPPSLASGSSSDQSPEVKSYPARFMDVLSIAKDKEVYGREVPITNMYSSNGSPFIIDIHLKKDEHLLRTTTLVEFQVKDITLAEEGQNRKKGGRMKMVLCNFGSSEVLADH
ncbi:hypothetical protein GOP47_0008878 [Adiantum capillus-veneris]|uniref:Uncharacterized protein n=1 Tax=Adiantum capillus-veneris TaxID=13818 RepID=A0A9D4UZD9_ADICA|nr:hypothetical protein GOP47_0008878 [Adiantum capillus-veneris]